MAPKLAPPLGVRAKFSPPVSTPPRAVAAAPSAPPGVPPPAALNQRAPPPTSLPKKLPPGRNAVMASPPSATQKLSPPRQESPRRVPTKTPPRRELPRAVDSTPQPPRHHQQPAQQAGSHAIDDREELRSAEKATQKNATNDTAVGTHTEAPAPAPAPAPVEQRIVVRTEADEEIAGYYYVEHSNAHRTLHDTINALRDRVRVLEDALDASEQDRQALMQRCNELVATLAVANEERLGLVYGPDGSLHAQRQATPPRALPKPAPKRAVESPTPAPKPQRTTQDAATTTVVVRHPVAEPERAQPSAIRVATVSEPLEIESCPKEQRCVLAVFQIAGVNFSTYEYARKCGESRVTDFERFLRDDIVTVVQELPMQAPDRVLTSIAVGAGQVRTLHASYPATTVFNPEIKPLIADADWPLRVDVVVRGFSNETDAQQLAAKFEAYSRTSAALRGAMVFAKLSFAEVLSKTAKEARVDASLSTVTISGDPLRPTTPPIPAPPPHGPPGALAASPPPTSSTSAIRTVTPPPQTTVRAATPPAEQPTLTPHAALTVPKTERASSQTQTDPGKETHSTQTTQSLLPSRSASQPPDPSISAQPAAEQQDGPSPAHAAQTEHQHPPRATTTDDVAPLARRAPRVEDMLPARSYSHASSGGSNSAAAGSGAKPYSGTTIAVSVVVNTLLYARFASDIAARRDVVDAFMADLRAGGASADDWLPVDAAIAPADLGAGSRLSVVLCATAALGTYAERAAAAEHVAALMLQFLHRGALDAVDRVNRRKSIKGDQTPAVTVSRDKSTVNGVEVATLGAQDAGAPSVPFHVSSPPPRHAPVSSASSMGRMGHGRGLVDLRNTVGFLEIDGSSSSPPQEAAAPATTVTYAPATVERRLAQSYDPVPVASPLQPPAATNEVDRGVFAAREEQRRHHHYDANDRGPVQQQHQTQRQQQQPEQRVPDVTVRVTYALPAFSYERFVAANSRVVEDILERDAASVGSPYAAGPASAAIRVYFSDGGSALRPEMGDALAVVVDTDLVSGDVDEFIAAWKAHLGDSRCLVALRRFCDIPEYERLVPADCWSTASYYSEEAAADDVPAAERQAPPPSAPLALTLVLSGAPWASYDLATRRDRQLEPDLIAAARRDLFDALGSGATVGIDNIEASVSNRDNLVCIDALVWAPQWVERQHVVGLMSQYLSGDGALVKARLVLLRRCDDVVMHQYHFAIGEALIDGRVPSRL